MLISSQNTPQLTHKINLSLSLSSYPNNCNECQVLEQRPVSPPKKSKSYTNQSFPPTYTPQKAMQGHKRG